VLSFKYFTSFPTHPTSVETSNLPRSEAQDALGKADLSQEALADDLYFQLLTVAC